MYSKSGEGCLGGRVQRHRNNSNVKGNLESPGILMVPKDMHSRAIQPRELPPLVRAPSFHWAAPSSGQKRVTGGGSKVPLALQLEAFLRKEHTLFLREHGDCTHADALHIVREAFSVIIEHFLDYRGVFSFIRGEYEATIEEVMLELRRLRAHHLENESERSLHIMELSRQREGFTTIISNLQAKLHATQGLTHSLRDQLATLEKSNNALLTKLELKTKECEDAMLTSKMLSSSMIEETTRNSYLLELRKADAREIGRLNAHVESLKEKLDDSEKRFAVLAKQMFGGEFIKRASVTSEKRMSNSESLQCDADDKGNEEIHRCVLALQRRIDDLLFDNELLRLQASEGKKDNNFDINEVCNVENNLDCEKSVGVEGNNSVVSSSKLIQSWLQEEVLTERELDALDFLLPPGNFEEDPLGFLKVCHRVRNLRMKKKDVIKLINNFWTSRQVHRQISLKHYFLEWLREKAGTEKAAKEIGVNMLHVCQRNLEDPDCRVMILTLRSFLPEDTVLAWQTDISRLEEACRDSFSGPDKIVSTSFLVNAIRAVMPEKSYVHMLQLRLYLWRLGEGTGNLPLDLLFNDHSHFVYMLKKQFLYEVEEFTLHVVEGIRSLSEDSNTVRLQDVTSVISSLDKGIPKGTLHRLVAEAAQFTAIDVAIAEQNFRVKLQPILHRFRTSVLLRRATPSFDEEQISGSCTAGNSGSNDNSGD